MEHTTSDQSVKTVLHSFSRKISGTAEACADRKPTIAPGLIPAHEVVTQGTRQLICTAGVSGVAQGQDAMIEEQCPSSGRLHRKYDLLCAKIIDRAATPEKVIRKNQLDASLDVGWKRCGQSRYFAGN